MVQDQKETEKVRTYPGLRVFQQQADAMLSQDNPDSGVPYVVLDTQRNVRIRSIAVICVWTEQPTPLESHVTIDGQPHTYLADDPDTAIWYYAEIGEAYAATLQGLGVTSHYNRAFFLEGRSVKVEAEITGGTVSNIACRVKWAKM